MSRVVSVPTSSLVASAARPLPFRARPDLVIESQTYQGRAYWIVKDPLALKYFRFEEEEFSLLRMLDGRASLTQIKSEFERKFAPQKIAVAEVHRLVAMLHKSGLLIGDAPGQGDELYRRERQQATQQRRATWTSLLSVRFRGLDMDGFLGWLSNRIGWIFSWPAAAALLCLALAALTLVLTNFGVFTAKLPAFRELFAAQNWLWLGVTLAFTKALHELGHGVACKRFGGECHEMGLMLLVLTPCLYCDVTDSWMLPSKWRRAMVSVAGMYVELGLASVATFLWWFSEPGLFNSLCLNVMFVSSVSTLMFNANPLLRYDGYYILADLIEVPNLRQKASSALSRAMSKTCLGIEPPVDPFLPARRRALFAAYAVASGIYRWVITVGILLFLCHVAEPYGLKVIGQIFACTIVAATLAQPFVKLQKFVRSPGRMESVKPLRLTLSLGAGAALLAGAGLAPLPHSVRCPVHLRPKDAAAVYIETSGRLTGIHAKPGDYVTPGMPLVTLENDEQRLEIVRLEGQRKQLDRRRESLRREAFNNERAGMEMAEVEKEMLSVADRLRKRRTAMARLAIAAPAAGVVLPPPVKAKPRDSEGRLVAWTGLPLEQKNLGAALEEGTLVCQVGDPRTWEAVLAVDQGDLEFVHPGQRMDLFLGAVPGRRFVGKIERIAATPMKTSPKGLSHKSGGKLLTVSDSQGGERPLSATYQASASLEDVEGLLFIDATGEAKVYAGSQTLAQRLWRWTCRTFHFDL